MEAAEDCGIFQQGKHFIMFWQVLHYVAVMTLSAFTRMMKEVKDLYWERHTHTHTHGGGSKCSYLVISDVLVLSCFYLLLLLFFLSVFVVL